MKVGFADLRPKKSQFSGAVVRPRSSMAFRTFSVVGRSAGKGVGKGLGGAFRGGLGRDAAIEEPIDGNNLIFPVHFSNSNVFGISSFSVLLEHSSFVNEQEFGAHVIGEIELLEATSFANEQSFGDHALSIELVAASFANGQGFGSHTIIEEQQDALSATHFTNTQAFGDHALSVELTAASFANAQAFGDHTLGINLEPTSFANAQTFGELEISVILTAAAFTTNTQSFGLHTIEEELSPGGFLRPDGVVAAGGWSAVSAADIPAALNEASADDSDYAQTGTNPASDVLEVSLSDVGDPGVHTGHVVRYRYGKSAAAGRQIDITVSLRQGASTQIGVQAHTNVGAAPIAGTFTLSEAEAGNITDYADLRLRFLANTVGGGAGRTARITWAELETPTG